MSIKTVFLDRDGVINKYPGDKSYVTRWKDFKFLGGAEQAIASLHKNRFKIFVVSNQAGVGKGIFTQKALEEITKKMIASIKKHRGDIDAVYYCTHQPQLNCACRKPKTGLIEIAKKDHHINLKDSFFIGDSIRDVITAKRAGCKSVLLLCGKEKISDRRKWEVQPDFIFRNLREAARFILLNQ